MYDKKLNYYCVATTMSILDEDRELGVLEIDEAVVVGVSIVTSHGSSITGEMRAKMFEGRPQLLFRKSAVVVVVITLENLC